jgi:hypothetical protein
MAAGDPIDSYVEFFKISKIKQEDFLATGLSLVKFIHPVVANCYWEYLKKIINEKKVLVPIRGYGRHWKTDNRYEKLYENLGICIQMDKANNSFPASTISRLSGFSTKKASKDKTLITNYQVSHIFGRTHNVFCFTAPWNIAYVPKIFDPLTGHEAKGELANEFAALFRQKASELFTPQIEDFNEIMKTYRAGIKAALEHIDDTDKFKVNVLSNFSEIAPACIDKG